MGFISHKLRAFNHVFEILDSILHIYDEFNVYCESWLTHCSCG